MTLARGRTRRRVVASSAGAALVAGLAAGLLAGCTGSHVGGSGDQGFISGDGSIVRLAATDRKRPETVSGTTLTGRRVSLAQYAGKVVVVNVWGSWCPPCVAEAPILAAAARDLQPQGIVFLGIDSRDPDRVSPHALQRKVGAPYDSIYDPDGRTLLAFHETLGPKSIPSTLIIDRQGRVAASLLGSISRTNLYDMVEDVAGRKLDGRT